MKQSIVERKIAWGDLDALGIVFYPRYYEWIDAAAHHFSRP
jgi:acyl-CoA thioesterase FadM